MKPELYTKTTAFTMLPDEWEELLEKSPSDDIFLTWQWQSTWWKHFEQDKELRLLALREERGDLCGLAPFFIESSVDGKRVMKFVGGTDITDYLDIIAKSGYEQEVSKDILTFWESIEGEWDFIDLHCLKETSTTLTVLKQLVMESKYLVEVSEEDVCPKIYLPSSWEKYLEFLNKKDRHELRRKIRRIERLCESVTDYSIKEPDSLAGGMELFMSLHRKSDARKEGFMNGDMSLFFKAVAGILFPENRLKLSFLQTDGTHVASSFCLNYRNKIYLYNSGYDPEHSYLSPGVVLTAYLIREAIDAGRSEFDFLRGREPYKYRFGAKDSIIYKMIINKREI